jgi:hypothetical protein
MQVPAQISPDGRYWWDGQTWQPMPAAPPPPPVAPPGPVAADLARPLWLPEGVALPDPPGATPPPSFTPSSDPEATPLWAGPLPKRHIITTVALWFGAVAGAGILLFGLLGIFFAQSAPPDKQSSEVTGALVMLAAGAVVFLPTFLNLTGFGGILTSSGGMVGALFGELGIVGVLVTFLMIIGTIAILTSPVGTARYGVPLAGVAMVVRRAWQGRWVAAGIITAVWAVGAVAALAAGH